MRMIDMKMNEESAKRVTWSVVAGTMAFVLAAVMLQVLAKPRVSAQSVDEVMAPNLTVEKTVNTAQASAGDTLTYYVRIRNTGTGEGVAALMTDKLPPDLIYVPDSLEKDAPGTASFAGGTVTWSSEEFGWGQTAVLTFSAQISPEFGQGQIVNTAEVTGAGELIQSSAQTEVQPAGMSASKSVYPSVTRPGGRVVYTVHIANTGDSSIDTIQVTDELPPEVSYVPESITSTVGSFGEAGGVVTWDVTADGPLAPLQEAALDFSVDVSPSLAENERFTNTAEVVGVGSPLTVRASAKTVSGFDLYMPYFPNRWPPIPYRPDLHEIGDPGIGVNDYTVRWSYEYTGVGVISYTLEEATAPNFVGAVEYVVPHSGPLNEKQFTGKPDGTYYYRVAGHNEYGEGTKSVVRAVTIFTAYTDDFSNSASGWPIQRGDIIDDRGVDNGDWYRRYINGQYQIAIGEASCWTCYWFLQPNALAPFKPPTDKYCVETKAKFEESGWWANMGLIFGANEANTKLYALCLSRGGDPDKLGWFLMMKDDYEFPKRGCSGPTEKIDGDDFEGTSRDDWNRLQVGVDGDKVKVWIGGRYKGRFTMPGLRSMTRVGLIGGVYEILTVDARFDNFKVIPDSDCTP